MKPGYGQTTIPWGYDGAKPDGIAERVLVWRLLRREDGSNTFTSVSVGTAFDVAAADKLIECCK